MNNSSPSNSKTRSVLYAFAVTPTPGRVEPGEAYFAKVERAAAAAVLHCVESLETATELCEYLDCVDAGAIAANPDLYRQVVASVSTYLQEHLDNVAAATLSHRSWAGKTLWELVLANRTRAQLRGSTPLGNRLLAD